MSPNAVPTLALMLVMAGTPVLAAPPSPAGARAYEGWSTTCDNLGACVALGAADGDGLFYLRIARAAGATAPPGIKIVLATRDGLEGAAPAFAMTAVEGGRTSKLGHFPASASDDDPNTFVATIDGEASLGLIDAVRNATLLDVTLLNRKQTLGLKGLSAALRDMDARQGRAGTPTALVAKGMTPVGQVRPPVEAPVVIAAQDGSAAAIETPVLSKALLDAALAAGCDADAVKTPNSFSEWRLLYDTWLAAVPCQSGAYNFQSVLFLTDGKGEAPKPLALPRPPLVPSDGDRPNFLINADFDPKTMVLSSFAKGRGIGDCGTRVDWLWTGRDFALLAAAGIDACPGALPDDWPTIYTATRR